MRASLRLASTITLALGLGSCSDPEPLGAIMLAMQTDMALPDDVAAVSLVVRSEDDETFGRILHDELLETYDTFTGRYVRFPATFAVVEGDNPNRRVRIRLAAFDNTGAAIVLNEAVTIVPHGRVALLRLPLQFTGQTSVKAGNRNEPDKVESNCDATGEVKVAGVCRSPEIDSSKLPTYDPKDVFGGGDGSDGSGTCFSIPDCLAGATDVPVDLATCSSAVPADATFNLALKRLQKPADLKPETAESVCVDGACFVPIEQDPEYGWRLSADGARIQYTAALCEAITLGKVEGVVGSALCATKTLATPLCAPWSSSSEGKVAVTGPPGLEGLAQPSFGAPERVGGLEPTGIRALGVKKGFVFGLSVTDDSFPATDRGRMKLLRYPTADITAAPTTVLATNADSDGAPNTGYRMAISETMIGLSDFRPPGAPSTPSSAYVVRGYETTPEIAFLSATGFSQVRAMTEAGNGLGWILDDESMGREYLATSPGNGPQWTELTDEAMVMLPPAVDAVTFDGTTFFFAGEMGITRCLKDQSMCPMEPVATLPGGVRIVSLLLDQLDVYAIDYGQTASLYKVAKDAKGVPASVVRPIGDTRFVAAGEAFGAGTPYALASDQQHIYWSDATGLRFVRKVDVDNPAVTPGTIDGAPRDIRSIAVDATHVYYGTLGGAEPAIYRVQKPPQGM